MRVGIGPVDEYDVEAAFSNYRTYSPGKQPSVERSRKERDVEESGVDDLGPEVAL